MAIFGEAAASAYTRAGERQIPLFAKKSSMVGRLGDDWRLLVLIEPSSPATLAKTVFTVGHLGTCSHPAR
ncbi:MAG TPA: hypothetical protein VMV10_11900 [Pirellulales bacterium]|nr:hypothetical protein [Pirellulales bacterium]